MSLRTLLRDNKHAVEKEQALKLIRTIVEVGTTRRDSETKSGPGIVPLSEAVMRSVVAVAEHPEDPFRLICIQTLAEICMLYSSLHSCSLMTVLSGHRYQSCC